MNKAYCRNIYLRIKYYSDINLLASRWLHLAVNKENSSYFDEDFNILFYDLSFDDFIDELLNFRNELFFYVKPQSELAIDILNDPQWIKIVYKAKQIIDQWNDIIECNVKAKK